MFRPQPQLSEEERQRSESLVQPQVPQYGMGAKLLAKMGFGATGNVGLGAAGQVGARSCGLSLVQINRSLQWYGAMPH
jgi:hypothetical protein